jgi:hypothetical protein
MSWRDQANEDCEFCHVLFRDDGVPLGCVLRLHVSRKLSAVANWFGDDSVILGQ